MIESQDTLTTLDSSYVTEAWANEFTMPNPMAAQFNVPESVPLVSFFGKANQPLVTIQPDGTVVIHEHGADREAAEIFYRSLEICGKSAYARIAELEARLAQYEAERSTSREQKAVIVEDAYFDRY